MSQPSVSQMMQKPLLAEAKTALQKNAFFGPLVSVTLPKFCEKLLLHAKFH